MIQIAAGLPTLTVGPKGPVLLAAQGGTSNFTLALSSLLIPGAAPKALPGEAKIAELTADGRQVAAEPGKELPEIGLDLSGDEDATEQHAEADDDAPANEDLPFAWLAQPVAPAPDPVVAAPVVATTKAIVAEKPVTAIVLPEAILPGEPVKARPAASAPVAEPIVEAGARPAGIAPAAEPIVEAGATPNAPAAAPAMAPLRYRLTERPVAVAQRAVPQPGSGEMPQAPSPLVAAAAGTPVVSTTAPAAAPAPSVAAPIVQPPVAAIVAPVMAEPAEAPAPMPVPARETVLATVEVLAPRVQATVPAAQPVGRFVPDPAQPLTVASLIAQASVQGVTQPIALAPLHRGEGELDQPVAGSITTPGAAILQQVAATPDAQQGTLDMRRHEWAGKMVEMIEAMRDAVPVKETRITLMPEALGKVDIAVRQDGDRIHVHFTAETAAARQILTDAQPRLTEVAEQRGIRLGQTSVDSQSAGAQSGQRQNDAQRPQTPSAPASARAANTTETDTDERIA